MTQVAAKSGRSIAVSFPEAPSQERRSARRHDMEQQDLVVQRFTGRREGGAALGKIVDLSAGGVRIRTTRGAVRPDHQIRVRIELPTYAGISPFVDTSGERPQPRNEWVGWMTVTRVATVDEREMEIGGRLVDMDEMDRGMLGLYLSTQPVAA